MKRLNNRLARLEQPVVAVHEVIVLVFAVIGPALPAGTCRHFPQATFQFFFVISLTFFKVYFLPVWD